MAHRTGMTPTSQSGNNVPRPLYWLLHTLLLGAAAAFLALHYVHLPADFPNQSPWMDWSKYTDEGWYGDAAIRHFQLGHWYVPGDFNPAAALPVWPLLEGLLFAVTGVSLVAARALTVSVFAAILAASWVLLARVRPGGSPGQRPAHTLAASAAVFLLSVSPFCFVFTRIAIIEPLLVLLTLLALLVAGRARVASPSALPGPLRLNLGPIVGLGILMPAMVLTKTTAVFLLPAVAFMLFAALEYRLTPFLRVALPAATIALLLWLSYFLLIVRPHYLLDYRYLFSANAYTRITRENFIEVLRNTIRGGMWMGRILYPAALVLLGLALPSVRRLRAQPLVSALVLWVAGYAAFLAYHNNIQPRYYLVIAVPLTLLVTVVPERLLLPGLTHQPFHRLGLAALAVLLLAIALPDARLTLRFVRHPDYTLLNAAREIHDFIDFDRRVDPTHSPLVLSISGSDLSLMTGLPSICDDFGTLELPDRVKKYRPGWYIAWNQIDDDKMDAITPFYTPVRVATFPAMDDPDRNVMVLYRLDPPGTSTRHPRKPTPARLRTKVGQQPSTNQLEH